MTVRDVATRLEISASLVYQLIDSGKLRCCRHGMGRGVIRVTEEQLAEYLEACATPQTNSEFVVRASHRPKLKHPKV
ncbi:Helix-turn-helix domain protein [Aquisphaera giovannonii]|uniref:Helix-turn-helix domain protein n=1 Tax=Aquisphaera giovannonii TaxID=406548 RepID=A0A5B9VWN5_9BACT|nr:helix-turn-helix domain-containing protein [Aquisphaera giovannonii]QEH32120.1 Helix-turn-helix domain protein [Aquisphaera giovannonii]